MDKNITKRLVTTLLLIPAVLGQTVLAKESWVERSDMIAYEVLESTAHFTPEFAGQTGVEGFDEEIFDLQPNRSERQIAIYRANIDSLESLLVKESDVRVRQDLQIIIKDQRNSVEATEIELARVLPYFNLPRLIFAGFNGLLDKQTPFERQRAALARLTTKPRAATAMASSKLMDRGSKKRCTDSQTIISATTPKTTPLVNPPSTPTFPVPKV